MIKEVFYPEKEDVMNSEMFSFLKAVNERFNVALKSYNDLQSWSVMQHEDFWSFLLEYSEIKLHTHYTSVLTGNEMFLSKWFEGATLNFAENLISEISDRTALTSHRENFAKFSISYSNLYKYTVSVAQHLKRMGVQKGDRVAGVISNIPEAVIMMLAATSLGAVWSSCSPEFGGTAILDRFEQIEPKVLLASKGYSYNGKYFSVMEKIESILPKLSSVKFVVWAESDFDFSETTSKSTFNYDSLYCNFSDLLNEVTITFSFTPIAFNDPVYIMYSSGTTGKPKCIVHGAGGTLLQHYKELELHSGVSEGSKILFYTTCGWMMWNWLVSSLMVKATVHLYDGSPVYPRTSTLWQIAEKEELSHIGLSPKFLSLCISENLILKTEHNLNHLKMILSTGAPLTENYYSYIYKNIKEKVYIASISGGTDIISCFMLGNPLECVFPGEIQGPGLGMAIEVWDENGKSLNLEKGELVCVKPFPSMPIKFWDDPDNSKYRNSYFNHFGGVWRHGDFIEFTITGGIVVYGRSDTTLNPGGVRIGTAEIYRVVEELEEILDSVVSAKEKNADVEIYLFIVLKNGFSFDGMLVEKIRREIKNKLSPRHIPRKIIAVSDIPRTINGKKVEIAVSRILNNQEVKNIDSIINPACLNEFRIAQND